MGWWRFPKSRPAAKSATATAATAAETAETAAETAATAATAATVATVATAATSATAATAAATAVAAATTQRNQILSHRHIVIVHLKICRLVAFITRRVRSRTVNRHPRRVRSRGVKLTSTSCAQQDCEADIHGVCAAEL